MNEFKPVAWLLMDGTIISEYSYNLRKLKEDGDIPLFTQRTWVGLTDEERNSLYEAHHDKYNLPNQGSPDGMDYERAIEAKLKEKNT